MAQKKKKFNLYNLLNEGSGRGVTKEDRERKRDFQFYFILFGRRLGTLVKLNLLWLFSNFPLFFGLLGLSGYVGLQTTAPASSFFANIEPLVAAGKANPIIASMFGITGIKGTMFVSTPATYVMYLLTLLVIFTFGLSNVGIMYVMRNIVRAEPLFILSDYWDAIRKNLRQGIVYGIIDLAIMGMVAYDIIAYGGMMRYVSIALGVIYLVMRFYIYIMISTFDLSIFKMFKNAMIFTAVSIKRNIGCVGGMLMILVINYGLLNIFYPLGALMPLALTISGIMFTGAYCAWPAIKEIMVDPYVEEQPEKPAEEPIFRDRG